MKRHHKVIVCACILITSVCLLVLLVFRGGGNLNSQAGGIPRKEIKVHKTGEAPLTESAVSEPENAEQNLQNPSLNELSKHALLQLIAGGDVSPGLLLAVYELTEDADTRERLKALQPRNPAVAGVLALTAADPEERLEWAKIWMECDPANSAGFMLAAGCVSASPDRAAFNSLLDGLAGGKPVDLYQAGRELEMLDSLRKAGVPVSEAKAITYTATGKTTFDLLSSATAVTNALKSEAVDPVEAASKGVAISRSLSGMKGLPASQALVAAGMEVSLLKRLDPAVEYGESGTTVGERVAEIQSVWKPRMETLERAEQAYENADETVRGMFEKRVEIYGEVEAAEWLLKQNN